jgi:predicted TIM-barrel fold metal-dependent hydrolase
MNQIPYIWIEALAWRQVLAHLDFTAHIRHDQHPNMAPRLIALEEHFDTGLFPSDALHQNMPSHLTNKLHDLGQDRVKQLDAGSCSMQVLSHIGSWGEVEQYVKSNDRLAAACREFPERFAGFAQLPMHDPEAAVAELERSVKDLGFVGALLNNHNSDGSMYDEKKYWPVFERAVELDVPGMHL